MTGTTKKGGADDQLGVGWVGGWGCDRSCSSLQGLKSLLHFLQFFIVLGLLVFWLGLLVLGHRRGLVQDSCEKLGGNKGTKRVGMSGERPSNLW